MIVVHVNPGDFAGIPERLLNEAVRIVFREEGVEEAEVSVTFLSDAEIREMNRHYLERDRPTDVLAFPLYEADEPVLGDVYIGFSRAAEQAVEREISLREELVRLTVHGVLHVLGYEHPEDEGREESEQFRRQEELVRRIGEETSGA